MSDIYIDTLNIQFADQRFEYYLKDEQGFIEMFVKSAAIQWILCIEVYHTFYKQGLLPFFTGIENKEWNLDVIVDRAYELVPGADDKLLLKLMKLILVFGTIAELRDEKRK